MSLDHMEQERGTRDPNMVHMAWDLLKAMKVNLNSVKGLLWLHTKCNEWFPNSIYNIDMVSGTPFNLLRSNLVSMT